MSMYILSVKVIYSLFKDVHAIYVLWKTEMFPMTVSISTAFRHLVLSSSSNKI